MHTDARGRGRALRATWHLDRTTDGEPDPIVVLSLWRDNVCTASFRLRRAEVPGLIAFLADGLDQLERRDLLAGLPDASGPQEGPGHADAG